MNPAYHFFSPMCWLFLVPETQYKWRNNFVSRCDMFVYCAKGDMTEQKNSYGGHEAEDGEEARA